MIINDDFGEDADKSPPLRALPHQVVSQEWHNPSPPKAAWNLSEACVKTFVEKAQKCKNTRYTLCKGKGEKYEKSNEDSFWSLPNKFCPDVIVQNLLLQKWKS